MAFLQSTFLERAGTAHLTTDASGNLTIVASVHDSRFVAELALAIPANQYRAGVAGTAVVVAWPYAPIARTLAKRYFHQVEE